MYIDIRAIQNCEICYIGTHEYTILSLHFELNRKLGILLQFTEHQNLIFNIIMHYWIIISYNYYIIQDKLKKILTFFPYFLIVKIYGKNDIPIILLY